MAARTWAPAGSTTRDMTAVNVFREKGEIPPKPTRERKSYNVMCVCVCVSGGLTKMPYISGGVEFIGEWNVE